MIPGRLSYTSNVDEPTSISPRGVSTQEYSIQTPICNTFWIPIGRQAVVHFWDIAPRVVDRPLYISLILSEECYSTAVVAVAAAVAEITVCGTLGFSPPFMEIRIALT